MNLGDDADTTGAIRGQLAGAFYDLSDILQADTGKFGRLIDVVLIVECPAKVWRLIEVIPEELRVI